MLNKPFAPLNYMAILLILLMCKANLVEIVRSSNSIGLFNRNRFTIHHVEIIRGNWVENFSTLQLIYMQCFLRCYILVTLSYNRACRTSDLLLWIRCCINHSEFSNLHPTPRAFPDIAVYIRVRNNLLIHRHYIMLAFPLSLQSLF